MLTNSNKLIFQNSLKDRMKMPLNAAEIIRWFSMQTFTSTEKEFSTWLDNVKLYILPNVWK